MCGPSNSSSYQSIPSPPNDSSVHCGVKLKPPGPDIFHFAMLACVPSNSIR